MDQTTLAKEYQPKAKGDGAKTLGEVKDYIRNTGIIIEQDRDHCFYSPSKDIIGMVDPKFFNKKQVLVLCYRKLLLYFIT